VQISGRKRTWRTKILRFAGSASRSAGPFFVALAPHMYNLADQFFGSQSFQNSQNQDLRFTFRVRNPRLEFKVTQLARIVVTV